jgi:hypothetical protein
MAEPKSGMRIFSLEEANMMLPLLRGELSRLRDLRRQIVAHQSLVDIEEMTEQAGGLAGEASKNRIQDLLKEIERDVLVFHRISEELHATGAELKDLDKGLVDFYGMHGDEIVYFCWADGEAQVSHWHALDSGFKGRRKFED